MSDTDVQPKGLQSTAFYSRKIQPVQYESAEASFFVQFEQNVESDFRDAMNKAKIATFEALGIEFTFDNEGNCREKFAEATVSYTEPQAVASVQGAFPGATNVTPALSPASTVRGSNPAGGSKIKVWSRLLYPDGRKDDRGAPMKLGNPSWLPAAAVALGVTDVWDNRKDHPAFGGAAKTKNGKDARNLPWFKEKDGEQAIWPPKDHPDASPTYVHPDFVSDARGVPNDDEEPF